MGSAPSQTAQAETPPPAWARRISDSRPIQLAVAPVARMTVWARTVSPLSVVSSWGLFLPGSPGLIETMSRGWMVVPKRSACFWNIFIISGPEMPSGKPG